MTKEFLLMSQRRELVQQLGTLCKKAHWNFVQVTTPTGLVVELENQSFAGIWWDLTGVTLDTTIATVTLVRDQVAGPITIFTDEPTERVRRKLFRAKVDDIIQTPFTRDVFRPLLEQRLWLYDRLQLKNPETTNEAPHAKVITAGNWRIDQQNYLVTKDDQQIELTPKEFQLLSYLIEHHGQVLSREQLVNGVWGYDILDTSRIVDIHISHLRDKLEDDPHQPQHLLTVRGFGYKLI